MDQVRDIREALRVQLQTVLGDSFNVYRGRPKNPVLPCVFVGQPDPLSLAPTQAADPIDAVIPVWGGVLWGDDEASDDEQCALLELLPGAVEDDRTLGGLVDDVSVHTADSFGEQDLDDGRTVKWFRLPVEVMA